MARILVTETIAESGLDQLRDVGHDVDVRTGLSPDELVAAIPGAAALIIRSATQVTAEVLEAGSDLVVVGRAGIGLDNVDVDAATAQGVMVVNAPQSNVVSAAEHTVALLLASARNVPQAHAALVQGKWERSRWSGVELQDKTLGVVGLGRVGRLVAQRMLSFGMRLVAYDPFVSEERAHQMSVELVSLDELLARSDFVTVHLPKNADTVGLIDAAALAKMQPHARIVNTARGGIVVESDLAAALTDGVIAGAGLDVFDTEPTTESPLFDLPNVVVTPHLGASTAEAQDKAGVTIAEMVQLALAGDFVPFAVNVSAREAPETLKPYLPLAERLGALYAALAGKAPDCLEVSCTGQIADYDTSIVTLSALRGVFGRISDVPVTFVNAPQLAEEHGVEVREAKSVTTHNYVNLIEIRCAGHAVAGTLVGLSGDPRIVMVEDHEVELPPSRHLLLVRNDDVPGMIGVVGGAVGRAGVNVSDMSLGRSPEGDLALMLLALDQPVPADIVAELEVHPGIVSVTPIDLGS